MVRLIKRYGSRKLYDTEESRYVSLEELAGWIGTGQQIRVLDNKTDEDVTVATLTQVISEQGRSGSAVFPAELLHDVIRAGGEAVSAGVDQLQQGVGRLLRTSMDRLGPVRRVREETALLRERLEDLERQLARMEMEPDAAKKPNGAPRARTPGTAK